MTAPLAIPVSESVTQPIPPGYLRIQYNIPQVKGAPRRSDLPTHFIFDVKLDASCNVCYGRGLRPLPKGAPQGAVPPACRCLLRRIERTLAERDAAMASGGVVSTPPAPADGPAGGIDPGAPTPRDRALAKLEEEVAEAERRREASLQEVTAERAAAETWRRTAGVRVEALTLALRRTHHRIEAAEHALRLLRERVPGQEQALRAAGVEYDAAEAAVEAFAESTARIAAHHDRKLAPLLARRERLRRRLRRGNGYAGEAV